MVLMRQEVKKNIENISKEQGGVQLKRGCFPKKSIGIDLGFRFVKIVEIVLSGGRLKINKLVMEKWPAGMIENLQENKAELKKILKKILKKNNITGKVCFSIPIGNVKIKTFTFPPMPLREVPEAVRLEIMKATKKDMEERSFDYVILDERNTGKINAVKVLAVTASKQMMLQYLNIFNSLGLNVLAIEPDIFSLIACLDYSQTIKAEDNVMLIDIGGKISSLNIIINKELRYYKTLRINGHMITSAVKDYCKISLEEAEQLLKNFNSEAKTKKSDVNNMDIKNAISFILEKLASEIERTFKYYSYEVSKSKIINYNKIIVTGGAANLSIVGRYLQERLNVAVDGFNPLARLEINKKARIKKDYLNNPSSFSVAIGLALWAVG